MAVNLQTSPRRFWFPRNRIAALFALIGFGLMIAAALDFRPGYAQTRVDSAILKMLLGAVAVGAAVYLSNHLPPLGKPLFVPLDRLRRSGWLCAGIGVLLLIIVGEISGNYFHIPVLQQVPSQLQYAMLLIGILLLGYGLGGMPSLNPRRLKIEWSLALPLLAILALALFLRLWNLEGSQRYLVDELHFSDGIVMLEGRPNQPILRPMSGESPYTWIFPYWQSAAVIFLGHNFAGFRFVPALLGTLTMLAAFGLARELFDRKTALLAALILATFPPHLHFSRTAIIQIADPLFGTMALMFVTRALRNNRRIEWAMAGVSLGMTQYFYEGARLLFPPLIVAFVILVALRGGMCGKWRGFLTTLVIAVIIGLPVYYSLIGTHTSLSGRYDDSGLGTSYWHQLAADGITPSDALKFAQHMLQPFQIYVAHPDLSAYYGGNQALVLEYLVPFFLFGCFYLLWRSPAPAFVIPLWIVATALGNGLLRDVLVSSRYEEVLPALALAIAAGVRYLPSFLLPESPEGYNGRVRRAFFQGKSGCVREAISGVIIAIIAVAQVNYYFGTHLFNYAYQVREEKPYRDGIDAVGRAAFLPGNTQIYLVGKPVHDKNVPRNWLSFLSRDGDPSRYFPLLSVSPDTISPKFLLDLPRGVNYAFFIAPDAISAIAQIERYFPGVTPPQYSPWNIPATKEYLLFFVPSETIPRRPPPKQG
ncbi:MAG: glycosyltransferase family 39 protein [Chloroflexota bacterium]